MKKFGQNPSSIIQFLTKKSSFRRLFLDNLNIILIKSLNFIKYYPKTLHNVIIGMLFWIEI